MRIMKRIGILPIAGVCLALVACSKSNSSDAKSMTQLYADNGRPVTARTLKPETFTVSLDFPAEFRARSQSTEYAKLSDVVREIHAKVGDRVEQDQVIVSFSMDNSSYQQAKLQFQNAETAYSRIQSLYKDNGVSKQDFDNARTQYELAREGYKAASDMIQVKAPIAGTVTQINVRTSSNVSPGTALFTISNQDGFEAAFYVTASEIQQIAVGAPCAIDYKGERIVGRVSEVSLIMDPSKKAFPAKAFFAGKPRTIVSGMTVDVSVEAYRNARAITAARSELLNADGAWYAFVASDGVARKKQVTAGKVSGLTYEILSGLTSGDALIEDGVQDLQDGDKIAVTDASSGDQ